MHPPALCGGCSFSRPTGLPGPNTSSRNTYGESGDGGGQMTRLALPRAKSSSLSPFSIARRRQQYSQGRDSEIKSLSLYMGANSRGAPSFCHSSTTFLACRTLRAPRSEHPLSPTGARSRLGITFGTKVLRPPQLPPRTFLRIWSASCSPFELHHATILPVRVPRVRHLLIVYRITPASANRPELALRSTRSGPSFCPGSRGHARRRSRQLL